MKRIAISLALITTTTTAYADSDWQLYSGIAAIGVGAVGFGLGYYEASRLRATQDDPEFEAYRRRFPSSEGDVCERARSGNEGTATMDPTAPRLAPSISNLCDRASTAQTLQWVFYGSGLALVTTGVVLLATRPKKDEKPATVSLTPAIGPRLQAMTLTVRF
jgi:hypothetical protein